MLQLPETPDGLCIGGVAAEMKAADALDCRDAAIDQDAPGLQDCLSAGDRGRTPVFWKDVNMGTAVVAADRLGVISACGRGDIFVTAFRTHGEYLHGCPLPVIGKRFKDRKPRAARGAVDKRMQISPVRRIQQLRPAFVTNGDVRGHEDLSFCLTAFNN